MDCSLCFIWRDGKAETKTLSEKKSKKERNHVCECVFLVPNSVEEPGYFKFVIRQDLLKLTQSQVKFLHIAECVLGRSKSSLCNIFSGVCPVLPLCLSGNCLATDKHV